MRAGTIFGIAAGAAGLISMAVSYFVQLSSLAGYQTLELIAASKRRNERIRNYKRFGFAIGSIGTLLGIPDVLLS
jgi:hypothetical protein